MSDFNDVWEKGTLVNSGGAQKFGTLMISAQDGDMETFVGTQKIRILMISGQERDILKNWEVRVNSGFSYP